MAYDGTAQFIVVERCRACHFCEAARFDVGQKLLDESKHRPNDKRGSDAEQVVALSARLAVAEKLLDDLKYRSDVKREDATNVEALLMRLDGFEKLLNDSKYRTDDKSENVEEPLAHTVGQVVHSPTVVPQEARVPHRASQEESEGKNDGDGGLLTSATDQNTREKRKVKRKRMLEKKPAILSIPRRSRSANKASIEKWRSLGQLASGSSR